MNSFITQHSAFHPLGLRNREMGFNNTFGVEDAISRSLYSAMKPIATWDSEKAGALPTGGMFNLEFSPEGSLMVAACEKKCFQIFDPLTRTRIKSINGAHSDCVNCVKFLDNRMFATCSDDATICVWDVRNLNKKIHTLNGHTKWVKNIEFSVKNKFLVTSALDGSIYTWDLNSFANISPPYNQVFHAPDLMRCRLSPDETQMVMCTTGGILVIIHDLDLTCLKEDLAGFKPNLYRLMQKSRQVFPLAADYSHLFNKNRKRNRIEFVTDFPEGNDAAVVSSLQIHPHGWVALSRNNSHDDKTEWTCIHDIQPDNIPGDKSVIDDSSDEANVSPSLGFRHKVPRRSRRIAGQNPVADRDCMTGIQPRIRIPGGYSVHQEQPVAPASASEENTSGSIQIQNDVWEASMTIRQARILHAMASRGQVGRNFNMQHITGINTGVINSVLHTRAQRTRAMWLRRSSPSIPTAVSEGPSTSSPAADEEVCLKETRYMENNKKRLLYYMQETNEGKGFIKELCFSSDGRIVCSPYGRGIRLLAYNDTCMELSQCVDDIKTPKQLVEVGNISGFHQDIVVCAKFSPRQHLLVTGCLAGRIVWYEPQIPIVDHISY